MRFKKCVSVLLALCMLLALLPIAVSAETTPTTYAQDTIQGSAILHCFNWSYSSIKAALPEIAAAGYTAVQTSPAQQPKDYSPEWTDLDGQWWKMYQPLGLRIAPTDAEQNATSWLGTKAELAALCAEADQYGIKVIVDIVANHLANDTEGGTFAHLSEAVDEDLKVEEYYHPYTQSINDSSRFNMTQYHMGMPDLNTGNAYIQQQVLNLLKECVDCGVDGFRFDAAKHIELPTDDASFASDFWPYVLDGASAYNAQKGGDPLFFYGEVLSGAGTKISNYTDLMAVTDNDTGDSARSNANSKNASGLASFQYQKKAIPRDCVLWAESHDTYMHSASSGISDAVIVRTWAIVGARADSTSLFLARPNETMGMASTDETWKDPSVAEINKFKNHFDGTSEYLSSSGNVAYIERGTNGIVISNLNGAGAVSLPVYRMKDGVYTDQVTKNTFTVSQGVISGTVGASGVAVIYTPENAPTDSLNVSPLYLIPSETWKQDGARFAMYVYNTGLDEQWVGMTDEDGDGVYEAELPEGEWNKVIFCRMDPDAAENNWDARWNQTADLYPDNGTNCFTVTEDDWNGSGTWSWYEKTAVGGEGYYLVGTMSDWNINPAYKLSENEGTAANEYVIDLELKTGDEFKVVYSADGETKTKWFPDPADNFGVDDQITVRGTYHVYFRPDYSGGDDWYKNCIYIELIEATPIEAEGYYLVGTMNGWSLKPEYMLTKNEFASTNEYYLDVELMTNDQFKVVYSDDGVEKTVWYPDPSENYGENGEITEGGVYRVYFRPGYDGPDDWFKNCLYVDPNSPLAASGYYLVGSMTGWSVNSAYKMTKIGVDPEEYKHEINLTTSSQFKVVYSANGSATTTWYPTGMGNNYGEHGEITASGRYRVYFRPHKGTGSEWFANYIKVARMYQVTVSAGTGNGTVSADKPYAEENETVTLTFEPETGYVLDTVTVTQGSNTVEVTLNDDNTASFVMPKGNVTVSATFKKAVYVIIFQNEDGTELLRVETEHGETPVYTGETPVKAPTEAYLYTFSGWTPQLSPAVGNAVYTATYTQSARLYNEPTWQWAEDYSSATATFTAKDDATFKIDVAAAGDAIETEITVHPGCTTEGERKHTATVVFHEKAFTNTVAETLGATGHDYGEPVYVWAETDTGYTVEASAVCRNDESHIVTETGTVTYEVVTEPSPGADGLGRYTAVFTKEPFTAQTKDVVLPMIPIVYGDANCDGKITSADAAMVLRSIVGLSTLTPLGMLNADVDCDTQVTAGDAAAILRYVIALIDSLPLQP